MIPGKINHHLLQDLTVIAKASRKGTLIYTSSSNKLHSGNILQKLSAFIHRNIGNASSTANELKKNHESAKNLVIDNLKDQIKIYFHIKNKAISEELESNILEFSKGLVDHITNSDSSVSNEKEVLDDFKEVLGNLSSITIDSTDIKFLQKSFLHTFILSELSLENKSKFKFSALQFNEILNKDHSNARPTDFNEIDLISQNALWIKKNKWIDPNRALSLGKEMARHELSGLTNNEKFNVLQKTLKSFEGKDINYYDENFSTSLENSAQRIKNKNIEKELKIDEKLAEFKKTLPIKEKKFINNEIMKEVLIANNGLGLSNEEIFAQYAWTLLAQKHNPITK